MKDDAPVKQREKSNKLNPGQPMTGVKIFKHLRSLLTFSTELDVDQSLRRLNKA